MFLEIDNNHFVNPDNIISIDKINTMTRLNNINGNQVITPKAIKILAARLRFILIADDYYINPKNIISVDVFEKYTRLTDINGSSITTTKSINLVVNKLNGIKQIAKKVR